MIVGSEMGYPGLARLIGRPESTGDQIIVRNMQVAARRRAAEAMSTAMMKGDVEGVLAALHLLGVRARRPLGRLSSASEKVFVVQSRYGLKSNVKQTTLSRPA